MSKKPLLVFFIFNELKINWEYLMELSYFKYYEMNITLARLQ